MLYSFYQNLSDAGLLFFLNGFIEFLIANMARLEIALSAIAPLEAVRDLYEVKFLKVAQDANHGSGDVAAKDEAKRAAVVFLEGFINTHIRPNKACTREDLINMGFPRGSSGGTSAIEESPWISLTQKESGVIKVHGQCKSMSGSGKPSFAVSLELGWGYKKADGAFPAAEETTERVTIFSATGTLHVPNTESGKWIIVYGRYHNTVGPGPWSAGMTIGIS